MKILIILTGFLPGKKFGGPPISVDNFCSLMNEDECFIVTRNHDMGETETYKDIKSGWNDRGNCKVLYLSDKEYGYRKYEEVIKEINPDVIYLQGLFQNCIIPCLFLAKKHNIPVLLAPRGELCAGAFKKKYKKVPYIIFLKIFGLLNKVHFQSTSEEETEAIMQHLGITEDRIHFLTNVPSIPKKEYPMPEKQPGVAKFVFISRIVRKKNLKAAISYFKNIDGDVTFDIYGPIEDKDYWRECQDEIKLLPSNIKVNYCGLVSHDQIHETFSRYHAFLFPTFSENFGHVIAEALSVGCPVIISDQTPWNDVEKYNAGWALAIDKEQLFVNAIRALMGYKNNDEGKIRVNSKKYFALKNNLEVIKKRYRTSFFKVRTDFK